MSIEDAIRVEGTVVEVLPTPLWRVVLPNGHQVLAHIPGRVRSTLSRCIAAGNKVVVEMSPYDLSQGRIMIGTDRNELP